MKVKNMTSRNGNKVANQFVITDTDNGNNKTVFQSYESMIAEIDYNNAIITIGHNYNYSVTTSKYRNMFFEENYLFELANLKGLEKAIAAGHIDTKYRTFIVRAES